MYNLIDFVNHGVLPFAGRKEDGGRLFEFWQGTRDSHEARALLLVSEAGMGKSRLLEELMSQVRRADGVVVHLKLYAESTIILAPLIAQALFHSEGGRALLREEPGKTLPSVISALRRLTRLRPVLLIIEDIHFLDQEVMGDFMALLNGIFDEPISIICSARPGDFPARGVLSRALVEELRLEGLRGEDLYSLWLQFFETPPDPDLIELLLEQTHGNPMALRTALRNALRSGAIARNETTKVWGLTVPIETFARRLADDVGLLSGGMTAHLSEGEKAAAGLLSTLGETFSRTSGVRLLGEEDERRIESLIFKGVLANPGPGVQPLGGEKNDLQLLGFTHSLIHHYLLQKSAVRPDLLLDVVAGGDPICSTVPYRLLRDHAAEVTRPLPLIRSAIEWIVADVLVLESTADWRNALVMLECADALFRHHEYSWSERERLEVRLKLMESRIRLLQRENHTKEYAELVESFQEATEGIPDELARYRLAAFTWSYGQLRRRAPYAGFRELWDRVEGFLEGHSALRLSEEYVQFLQVVGRTTHTPEDVSMLPVVDERLNLLLTDPDVPEGIRIHALREVAPFLLWRFSSREELRERLELLRRLLEVAGDSVWFRTRAMAFYEGIGRVRQVLELGEDLTLLLRRRDLRRDLAQVRLLRLSALAGLGGPTDRIDTELQSIVIEAPSEIQSQLKRMVGRRFSSLALARGDTPWALRILDAWGDRSIAGAHDQLLLACEEGNVREMLPGIMGEDGTIEEAFGERFLQYLQGKSVEMAELEEELLEHLSVPFYIRGQVIDRHVMILLIGMIDDEELRGGLRGKVKSFVVAGLEWLYEHELASFGLPLLERAGDYLTKKEMTAWRERFAEQIRCRELPSFMQSEETRIEISMIGEICVKLPGEPRQRVRGSRLRTVLGLMVAGSMVPQPLSYREFCRLASGGEDDPERARKMSSMGLLRLREAYGDDLVIVRDGESPSLNYDRVRVDILDVVRLIREARHDALHGSLMRAHPTLREALQLLNGEVPFPALYDDFFEAIRGDVDYLVREGILDVARGLISEKDLTIAEEILRLGVRVMPQDEEIVDLLLETLTSLGKRTEAERVKMRQEEIEQGW